MRRGIMKRLLQPKNHATVLLAGTALLFAACASTPTAQVAGPRVVLDKSDYEYVTVTGSNIPVLVAKDKSVTSLPGSSASDVTYLSPEAFRNLVTRGTSTGTPH
jgi:hypothetical protein